MKKWIVILSSAAISMALTWPSQAYQMNQKTNEVSLVSLKDFEKCMNDFGNGQADVCLDGLKKYIGSHKKQAFEAGKLARLHLQHWTALPFFETAMKSSDRKKFCADEDVRMAALSGLGLPPGREENPVIAIAQKIAIETCWDSMKHALNQEAESGAGYLRDNACASFKAKKIDQKYCHIAPATAETKPAGVDPEVLELAKTDVSSLEAIDGTLKVFIGDEGKRVTMVQVKPESSNRFLVRFEGFRGPWNNRAILHIGRDMGNGKLDYVTVVDGAEWSSVVKRGYYSIYPKGDHGNVVVTYSKALSAKAAAIDVLKAARSLASE